MVFKSLLLKNKNNKTLPHPQNGATYLQHRLESLFLVCPNRIHSSDRKLLAPADMWESSSYIYKSLNCGFL